MYRADAAQSQQRNNTTQHYFRSRLRWVATFVSTLTLEMSDELHAFGFPLGYPGSGLPVCPATCTTRHDVVAGGKNTPDATSARKASTLPVHAVRATVVSVPSFATSFSAAPGRNIRPLRCARLCPHCLCTSMQTLGGACAVDPPLLTGWPPTGGENPPVPSVESRSR